MISSYLLMKFVQKSRTLQAREAELKRMESVESTQTSSRVTDTPKCRVCLHEGTIPIYGDDDSPDISESVASFADIEMSQEDDYPKYICDTCHKLLEGAIMFRKTAQQSNLILKDFVKTEYTEVDFGEDSPSSSNNDYENIQDLDTKKFFTEKKKKKYHCKVCFVDYKFLDEYYDHVKSPEHIKQKMSPNIRCRICNKTLRRYYFKQHLDLHKSERLYKVKCKICKQFYRKGEYKEHVASHGPPTTTYICEVCGRSFNRRSIYKCHLQTHSTDFPYKCQYCPYKGRNSGLLAIHLRTHTGDYRYQCSVCSARFLTSSNLNRHMSKHQGRKFACDTCKRRFYSKHELEQHFKVDHLGIKEHSCNMCGKAFGYRNAMKKHQLHVHKREKFIDGKGRMPAYLEVERKKEQGVL